jgi:hypothetical protein
VEETGSERKTSLRIGHTVARAIRTLRHFIGKMIDTSLKIFLQMKAVLDMHFTSLDGTLRACLLEGWETFFAIGKPFLFHGVSASPWSQILRGNVFTALAERHGRSLDRRAHRRLVV